MHSGANSFYLFTASHSFHSSCMFCTRYFIVKKVFWQSRHCKTRQEYNRSVGLADFFLQNMEFWLCQRFACIFSQCFCQFPDLNIKINNLFGFFYALCFSNFLIANLKRLSWSSISIFSFFAIVHWCFTLFISKKNADVKTSEQEITENLADMQIMDGKMVNGKTVCGPPGPPSQHIALHLLSKVLDDETIFNLEEGNNSPAEAFLPLTVDPTTRCVSKLFFDLFMLLDIL